MNIDRRKLSDTLADLKSRLLNERIPAGHWTGELSSSALSTATAVFALASANSEKNRTLIAHGLDWLKDNQNPDGGWGDTTVSQTNISTTMLCWAALSVAEEPQRYANTTAGAEKWMFLVQ